MTKIFNNDSKSIISIAFDELSGKSDLACFNQFRLTRKRTYCNLSDVITEYCNIIIGMDDDSSLLLDYLKMRIDISSNNIYDIVSDEFIDDNDVKDIDGTLIRELYTPNIFRDDLFNNIITDELLGYIDSYIEDNYDINVDAASNKSQINDSLTYTDEHCRILLKISTLQKYLIPLVMEYIHQNYSELVSIGYKTDDVLLEVFEPLFTSEYFKNGKEIDLIQKLYESVKSKVQATQYSDKIIWSYCNYWGIDWISTSTDFTNKLFTDISPKFILEKNVVNLIYVVIKKSLENFFKINFPVNYKTIDVTKENDEISNYDKMEISNAKIDESEIIINKNNLDMTIYDIIKRYKIKITQDEFEFYRANININSLQQNLVFLFFSNYFNGQKSLFNASKKEYTMLLIILRKIFEVNSFECLQELILGNIINKVNEKRTINKKQLLKITESKKFKFIISEKFKHIGFLLEQSKIIERLIATIINNKFSYVNYEHPELLGEEVKVNQDILTKEILRFIEMI